MDKVRELLDHEIEEELKELSNIDFKEKDERSKTIEELTQLYKLRIEEAKIEQANFAAICEKEAKEAQVDSQAKDRWFNIALQVGLAIGGWVAYDIWNRRGLKFEETGTITSPMTRNLLSRMLPKK